MPVPERGCFTAHWSVDIGAIAVVSGPDAGRIINLGATLPARTPIAARPGLGWWVADGRTRLVQVHAGPHHQSTTLHPGPMTSDDMLAR